MPGDGFGMVRLWLLLPLLLLSLTFLLQSGALRTTINPTLGLSSFNIMVHTQGHVVGHVHLLPLLVFLSLAFCQKRAVR